jgi:sugar O-acyltransferase (sialic acid O-acetyltransferase NeuD family)
MSSKKIVLIGAGGHAKACIEIIESAGKFSIAQIVGQSPEIGSSVLGHVIKHTDADLALLREEYEYAFIGIGQMHNPEPRREIHSNLLNLGYQIPTIISKHAIVSSNAKIGTGSIVMNGAILNANCTVGENVIVNSSALLEHDVFVGADCHISTRVTINGNSRIGQGTFLGSGTVIRNGIEIGENSFVDMGSVITESLPPNSRYRKNS